jgi:hypothetical protein
MEEMLNFAISQRYLVKSQLLIIKCRLSPGYLQERVRMGSLRLAMLALLWCSFSLLLAAGEPDAERVRNATASLLETGFQGRAVSAEELERIYQRELHELGQPHPYLDYAYWIVLSKNFASKTGIEHLIAAAQCQSPIVLPAREQLVRSQISAGHHEEALEMLVDLAEQVGAIREDEPTAADAHRSARWIGQILAFLQGPAGLDPLNKRATAIEVPIRTLLGDRYRTDFQNGRAGVVSIQRGLVNELNAALREAQDKKSQTQGDLQDKKETIAQRQQALAETADQLRTSFKEKLSGADDRLKVMEKQFAMSLEAEQRIQATQILLQAEINRLKQQMQITQNTNANNRNTNLQRYPSDLEQALGAAEIQYALTVNQYALLLQSRYELTRQAQQLLAQRQAVAAQFQSTRSEMQSQQALMNRWQSRLDQTARLEAQTPLTKEPTVNSIRRRMSALSSYDTGTIVEQRRLLTDLLEMTAPVAKN